MVLCSSVVHGSQVLTGCPAAYSVRVAGLCLFVGPPLRAHVSEGRAIGSFEKMHELLQLILLARQSCCTQPAVWQSTHAMDTIFDLGRRSPGVLDSRGV